MSSTGTPSGRRFVAGFRGRLTRVVTALLGVGLLAVALASTVAAGRASAVDDLDHELTTRATASAAALSEYFDRARSINLLLANDAAFDGYRPGEVAGDLAPAASGDSANRAMAYLETLYPGRISEACLIDRDGVELARVVEGEIASGTDLSGDESGNPFFAPTLRLPAGRVYQAAPYVSEDTDQWVISNSTPMVDAAGVPWGLVHFELALDTFRPAADSRSGYSAAIVDTRTGRLLLEDDRPLGVDEPGRAGSPLLEAAVGSAVGVSSATVDGHRVAVARVAVEEDNANAWAVVVTAPESVTAWSGSIGPAPVAMLLAAVVLLVFAGLNLRGSQRELRHASLTDELTGLPNRRLLNDRVEQALLLSRRRGSTSALLLVDLDRFKEVNDTLGHHYGDRLLQAVAERLVRTCRASDTVARLGGDEFAVLLLDIGGEPEARLLAERCLSALHEPLTIENVVVNVEASIGLALGPLHGDDRNSLLRAADVAMYEAKEHSGSVVAYDPDHDVNTPSRLALLGDLRRALANDELVMLYQPKVDLSTDEVRSVEALVRWNHPTRGLVMPSDFIGVAEGTALILPLTLQTLELAIRQAKVWMGRDQAIQVAVNLSPRCLLAPAFPAAVREVLRRHSVPEHLLRLEITENSIMADPARAMSVLADLRSSGIALSIDDFGTGYSSMTYLKRLPVDELKIDRSFVLEMSANRSDETLVRSCIELGHNLGLSVVAEGVEDEATMAALTSLGCDVVQGYHLARPMTGEAVDALLQDRALRRAVAAQPDS